MTPTAFSRRHALKSAAGGFGYLAFAGMLGLEQQRAAAATRSPGPLVPRPSHFPTRAK
ncbi:MAG: hypothetical protein JNG89_17465, partial [Planctomycetaceae bacterium]|nr:hypothetical protein [Planctomycetaceae bacterium]